MLKKGLVGAPPEFDRNTRIVTALPHVYLAVVLYTESDHGDHGSDDFL